MIAMMQPVGRKTRNIDSLEAVLPKCLPKFQDYVARDPCKVEPLRPKPCTHQLQAEGRRDTEVWEHDSTMISTGHPILCGRSQTFFGYTVYMNR